MKQQGMSLVEVMVAVAILAAGLLSLGALQAQSVMLNQSAYYRSIAAGLASDLADRIRTNRSPFLAVDSTGAATPTGFPLPPDFTQCPQNGTPDTAPTCADQTGGRKAYLVSTEMAAWNTLLRAQLSNGKYTLASADAGNGFLRYTLTLTWTDNRSQSGTGADSTYVTVIE